MFEQSTPLVATLLTLGVAGASTNLASSLMFSLLKWAKLKPNSDMVNQGLVLVITTVATAGFIYEGGIEYGNLAAMIPAVFAVSQGIFHVVNKRVRKMELGPLYTSK